jgi:hypothetical protein
MLQLSAINIQLKDANRVFRLYIKLLLVEANMLTVRDIVGNVKPTSPRSENSVNVVE